ncbi:MAG: hypothetical protein ABR587_15540 [Candidatus Binatia bacterium]
MATNSRNTRLGLSAAAVALLAAAWWMMTPAPEPAVEVASRVESPPAADAAPVAGSSRREERRPAIDTLTKDEEAVAYLREQFGATIEHKRTQIKALEKLIAYLMKTYPDDWQQRLKALLAEAFPGMGDQLYAQFQNMTAYNEWLAANRIDLNQMTPGERRDAMNEARFRFFGPDAAEIFEESLRHERIYDTMDAIDQSDAPVGEKLSTYLESINEAYGENAPDFLERRQTELMTKFLALPSVQEDLHAMAPAARQQQLHDVRAAMGLDDEALARWRDLDQQRDEAWNTGERYMDERDDVTRRYQGDEQARRLGELRARTFGPEAETIQQEEDSGFFRFGRRRVYGKE